MSFIALLALVASGCEQRSNGSAAATPAPPAIGGPAPASNHAPAVQTPTVAAKMADHFASSVALRDALVSGDLDRFRAAAASLSDKELSANLSPTWTPYLEAMRSAAKRARDAGSLELGAQAIADLGLACAACHAKLGMPKLTVGSPPAPGSGAALHMDRHHWAAARLWEGLMVPSEEAWMKGAEVFADAPLQPEAIAVGKTVPPEVNELARRAHASGQRAHSARDAAARAQAVAEVYGSCVGCHAKLAINIK